LGSRRSRPGGEIGHPRDQPRLLDVLPPEDRDIDHDVEERDDREHPTEVAGTMGR
jgi:hypothetical protein